MLDDTSFGFGEAKLYESIAEKIGAERIETTEERPEKSLGRILKGLGRFR